MSNRFWQWLLVFVVAIGVIATGWAATSQYQYKDNQGNTFNIQLYQCGSLFCTAMVLEDSSGTEKFTNNNPGVVTVSPTTSLTFTLTPTTVAITPSTVTLSPSSVSANLTNPLAIVLNTPTQPSLPVNITSLTQTVTVSPTGAYSVNCVSGCSGAGQTQLTSPFAVVLNTTSQPSLPVNITSLTQTVTVSPTNTTLVNCVSGCSGSGQSQLTSPLAFVLNTPTQPSVPVNITSLTETVTITPSGPIAISPTNATFAVTAASGAIFGTTPTNGSIFVTTPTNGAQVVTASSAWIVTQSNAAWFVTPTGNLPVNCVTGCSASSLVITNPLAVVLNTPTQPSMPVNITSLTETVTVSPTNTTLVNCVSGCSGSGQTQLTSPFAVVLNTPVQPSLPVNVTSLTETVTVSPTGAYSVNCISGCSGAGQTQLTSPFAIVLNTPVQPSLPVNITSLTETVTITPTGALPMSPTNAIFAITASSGAIFTMTPTNASIYVTTPTNGAQVITASSALVVSQTGAAWFVTPTGAVPVSPTNAVFTVTPTDSAWGIAATNTLATANGTMVNAEAASSEPVKATTGNAQQWWTDLVGKSITSPYANRENYLQAAVTLPTNAGSTTLFGAQGANLKVYMTGIQCSRNDAGTTAQFVTFTDGQTLTPTLVLPNSGGGGGNNAVLNTPFSFAANATVTIGTSGQLTSVYCNAQGYKGY